MAKPNAWRHDIQWLYFQFLNVNLGKNLGIDLESFVEQAPGFCAALFSCRTLATQ